MADTIKCPDCGEEIECTDTTYCNYESPRAAKGEKTGDIYYCEKCECHWLDSYIRGELERWSY